MALHPEPRLGVAPSLGVGPGSAARGCQHARGKRTAAQVHCGPKGLAWCKSNPGLTGPLDMGIWASGLGILFMSFSYCWATGHGLMVLLGN